MSSVTAIHGRTAAWVAATALALLPGCSDEDATEPPPQSSCVPTAPSRTDPFAAERDPDSADVALAEAIAQHYMAEHPPEQLTWDWGEATFVVGLVDLYRVTAEPSYRDYAQRWIDYYVGVGYDHLIVSSDRCPPALAALSLYQETCHEPYRQVVNEVLEYLYDRAARTDEGGISHMGVSELFAPTLWVDSLFMFGGVLTRWGAFADDSHALDEMAAQIDIFATQLQDDGGLLRHAHNWQLSHDDVYWARGNGWVTAATSEYLRARQERGETDGRAQAILDEQVAGVAAAQDPTTGLWWTILDRPGEIYLETSATALFALGLARGYRAGLLAPSVRPTIAHAMDAVRGRIIDGPDGQPVVTGISGPTTVGTFDDYAAVELGDDIHYGVGAVILALLETSGL